MAVKYTRNGVDMATIAKQLEAALLRAVETKSPEDQAEAVRLNDLYNGFRSGCGACAAGRKLFFSGMGSLIRGDFSEATAQNFKGALKAVALKLSTKPTAQ